MKNTYKLLSSFIFVFIVLLAMQNKVNAQCSLMTRDASGTTITTAIDCDFPIYKTTGEPIADQAIVTAWVAEIKALYPEWGNATNSYFVVHQSDLENMTGEHKAALMSNPFVHILP